MPLIDSERLSEDYIKNIFESIDKDKKGWISKSDIQNTLFQFGITATPQHISSMFKKQSHDQEVDFRVTLSDFRKFVRAREDNLYDIFKKVKTDKHGKISQIKLARAFLENIETANDAQDSINISTELISLIDRTGDIK